MRVSARGQNEKKAQPSDDHDAHRPRGQAQTNDLADVCLARRAPAYNHEHAGSLLLILSLWDHTVRSSSRRNQAFECQEIECHFRAHNRSYPTRAMACLDHRQKPHLHKCKMAWTHVARSHKLSENEHSARQNNQPQPVLACAEMLGMGQRKMSNRTCSISSNETADLLKLSDAKPNLGALEALAVRVEVPAEVYVALEETKRKRNRYQPVRAPQSFKSSPDGASSLTSGDQTSTVWPKARP